MTDTSIKGHVVGDWQPIDTAPRDGTVILIYRTGSGDQRATIAYVNENGDWSCPEEFFLKRHPPTHWQPLPKPPSNVSRLHRPDQIW